MNSTVEKKAPNSENFLVHALKNETLPLYIGERKPLNPEIWANLNGKS